MERLTTDQENDTFSCFNIFYAKGGEIWVRGGGPYPEYQDVTLVQWIRSAAQKHGLNITAEDPEHLGDEMYDALQDGDETVEGIVALLHAAAVQATEMRERLKMIENIVGKHYDLDRLRVMYNQRVSLREEVAERWELTKHIQLERLKELVEADRDGRCVVFKFGMGSTVYRTWVRPDGRCPFVSVHLIDTVEDLVNAEKWDNAYATREAAEQALRGIAENGT